MFKTGLVKVLLVNVSVVALPINVSVAFGKVSVLSTVGSVTVNVVSKLSAVAPSKIIVPAVSKVNDVPTVGVFITGLVKILFVSVSLPVNVVKLSLCKAALNSATEPVTVLVPKSIDLFVNVSVVALPIKVSLAFGSNIVLSTSGSTTCNVVSKLSSVVPSNIIEPDVATKNEPVTIPVLVIAPEFTVPAKVVFAPLNVAAVVADEPDFITSSPPLFVNRPKLVPPSFNFISAPSASNTISAEAFTVNVVAFIVLMVGVVKVLFVRVSVVFLATKVSVAVLGKERVISPVGLPGACLFYTSDAADE